MLIRLEGEKWLLVEKRLSSAEFDFYLLLLRCYICKKSKRNYDKAKIETFTFYSTKPYIVSQTTLTNNRPL
jgi:hypothetical protein